MLISTYITSSESDLQILLGHYMGIPTPGDGFIKFEFTQMVGGRMNFESAKVLPDRYPILLVRCVFTGTYAKGYNYPTTNGGGREVFEQDVLKFVEEHPGRVSMPNCVLDGGNRNAELLIAKAAEIVHNMIAKALPPTPPTGNDPSSARTGGSRLSKMLDALQPRRWKRWYEIWASDSVLYCLIISVA
jgi:hypothetical protein